MKYDKLKTSDYKAVEQQHIEPVNRIYPELKEKTKTELRKLLHQKDDSIDDCQPILGYMMQVIVDLFPDIVRDWFMKYFSLEELMKEISREESLQSLLSDHLSLTEYSLDKLFEIGKKLMNIKEPEKGWETYPNDTDQAPSDDIVRMILLAKRVRSRLNSFISAEERDRFMTETKNVVSRFDTLLDKQLTFQERLTHLSNEWEFLVSFKLR